MSTLHKSRAARVIAFDALAELDQDHPEITNELVNATSRAIDRAGVLVGVHIRHSYVRNWLENPGWYTPHIDDVAVRRALDFDLTAIRGLSSDETDLFYGALYLMGDRAFDYYAASEAHFYAKPGEALQQSPRRVRYLSLPKELQVKLRDNTTKSGPRIVAREKDQT